MGILTKKSGGMTEIAKCFAAFCLSVVLGLSALLVAAFVPDGRIYDTLSNSARQLQSEGIYPRVFDHGDTARLDNYSDSLMLLATASMNSQDMASILKNPIYSYVCEDAEEGVHFYADDLQRVSDGDAPDGIWFYPRYWLGFRAVLRILLTHFDYFQIRRYVAVLFFLLYASVICSITKKVDGKTALVFAASVILVRPQVIVSSMQFSCCFLIAFGAMLLVPLVADHPRWDCVFFLELGVITMFFDFYTVPVITLGLPLVYLSIVRSRQGDQVRLGWVIQCVVIWLGAYGLMWLTKLWLTTALTPINGFEDGYQSFLSRIGVMKKEGLEEYYNIGMAFKMVREALYHDYAGSRVYCAGAFLLLLSSCVCAIWNKVQITEFARYGYLLVVAVLPLLWFAVAAQPIAIHYWFQYRSIALTYWALGAYLSMTCWDRGNTLNMIPAQKS